MRHLKVTTKGGGVHYQEVSIAQGWSGSCTQFAGSPPTHPVGEDTLIYSKFGHTQTDSDNINVVRARQEGADPQKCRQPQKHAVTLNRGAPHLHERESCCIHARDAHHSLVSRPSPRGWLCHSQLVPNMNRHGQNQLQPHQIASKQQEVTLTTILLVQHHQKEAMVTTILVTTTLQKHHLVCPSWPPGVPPILTQHDEKI